MDTPSPQDVIARAKAFADKNLYLETATNLIYELVAALEAVTKERDDWMGTAEHRAKMLDEIHDLERQLAEARASSEDGRGMKTEQKNEVEHDR